jgi:hypothetical protein
LIKLEVGIDIVHVPHKGAAGASPTSSPARSSGSAVQTIAPQVRAGKACACDHGERALRHFRSSDFEGTGIARLSWRHGTVCLRRRARPPQLRNQRRPKCATAQPEVRKHSHGTPGRCGGPERFGEMVGRELGRWARVVSAAKIKPD